MAVLLLQDSEDVCDTPSVILPGVRLHDSPDGLTDVDSVTVPVKPLRGATVIVEVAVVPTLTLALVGLALTVKSVTATVTVAVWVSEPLVPVTVTV